MEVKTYSKEQLDAVVAQHKLWLENDPKGVRAYLTGENLTGANLAGAYLTGANLAGAYLNWQSHWLLAELLRREAEENLDRRKIAGLIAISPDWCWRTWAKIAAANPADARWVADTLAKYSTKASPMPAMLAGWATSIVPFASEGTEKSTEAVAAEL